MEKKKENLDRILSDYLFKVSHFLMSILLFCTGINNFFLLFFFETRNEQKKRNTLSNVSVYSM